VLQLWTCTCTWSTCTCTWSTLHPQPAMHPVHISCQPPTAPLLHLDTSTPNPHPLRALHLPPGKLLPPSEKESSLPPAPLLITLAPVAPAAAGPRPATLLPVGPASGPAAAPLLLLPGAKLLLLLLLYDMMSSRKGSARIPDSVAAVPAGGSVPDFVEGEKGAAGAIRGAESLAFGSRMCRYGAQCAQQDSARPVQGSVRGGGGACICNFAKRLGPTRTNKQAMPAHKPTPHTSTARGVPTGAPYLPCAAAAALSRASASAACQACAKAVSLSVGLCSIEISGHNRDNTTSRVGTCSDAVQGGTRGGGVGGEP
jgi:hypothetical protein